jgi:hypothetical protein
MATISRLYDTYEAAAEAVRDLLDAGIPRRDISLVSNNAENWYSTNTSRGTRQGQPLLIEIAMGGTIGPKERKREPASAE